MRSFCGNGIHFLIISLLLTTSLFFFTPIGSHAAVSSSEFIRPPARSILITPHNRSAAYPQQVHVSLVGDDGMRVSWITEGHAASLVEYGTEPGNYEASSKGDHITYHYFLYSSGKIHNAVIRPLKPNSVYYYRCSQRGPEFSFRTPPSTFPVEFVVVGDLGQTEWTKSTLQHIGEKDYDVLLLPGDLSYADTQQPLWDSFGRLVEPYASQRPWMVTEGNHEIEFIPLVADSFRAYNARWPMPYKQSNSSSNLYYSFQVAGAHIIMLGSYADFGPDSEQYAWLKADLASIDRSITPWVFVVVHAPWYNSNEAHKGEGEDMKTSMEDLLYNARVDIVFAGHVHAYERFMLRSDCKITIPRSCRGFHSQHQQLTVTRVYKNKADRCGPIYITIGDGGNREGLALTFEEAASISEYREASFGHGRLRIIDDQIANWCWHRNNYTNSFAADQQLHIHSLTSSARCSPKNPIKTTINDEL